MVGGGAATFDCNDDGFPDMLLAGGENSRRNFYRNASAQGGALQFVGERAGSNWTTSSGAYPLDVDGDGVTDLILLRVGENVAMRGLGECRFERANEAWGFRRRRCLVDGRGRHLGEGRRLAHHCAGQLCRPGRGDLALGLLHRQLAAAGPPPASASSPRRCR